MINSDGSINPSYMNWFLEPMGQNQTFNDHSLKVGRVIAIYYPDDSNNVNKKFTEYDVEAKYTEGNSPPVKTIFYRCVTTSLFGGIADYIRWTPRLDNSTSGPIKGSLVLLLCQNGNQRQAYIVGGIPQPETQVKDLAEHSFVFEFNGMNLVINKDGELLLKRKGVTNEEGKVDDTSGSDSFIQFKKSGDIVLGYLDKVASDYASIQIQKANKILQLYAKSHIESKTEDEFRINTTNGVKVNGADQAWVRGTIYRQKQVELHQKLKGFISALSGIVQTTGTALTTGGSTLATASVSNAVPMVGGIIAAPSFAASAAAITLSGSTLIGAVSILNQMSTAIETFEASANDYLSKKHFAGE